MTPNIFNPYRYVSAGGFPISGTHGYSFDGVSGDGVTIQDQELGVDTTGNDKSDMTQNRERGCNAQTSVYIYCMGGNTGATTRNTIDVYTIGTTSNAVDEADLFQATDQTHTHCYDSTYAYVMGGYAGAASDVVQSYEMGSTTTAIDKADMYQATTTNTGGTNETYSYSFAGHDGSANDNLIQEYSNASTSTASHVADSAQALRNGTSAQSTTVIVNFGGYTTTYDDMISSYTMETTTNASDRGNLTLGGNTVGCGAQTETYGFVLGGHEVGVGRSTAGQSYEFGTDSDSTEVGDLAFAVSNCFSGGTGTP